MEYDFLNENKIIPVVVFNDVSEVKPKLSALIRGGINAAEITFRTECAEEALKLAVKAFPDMLIGAGTVISAAQCNNAVAAGARFIVSPGLSAEVADICASINVPYIAGVVTPTEIIAAKELGLSVLKFFPAGAYGGVKTLKVISAAFPDVKFVPTGGVDAGNLQEFLSAKFVVAVGGSWMMNGNPDEIEELTREAVSLAKEIK